MNKKRLELALQQLKSSEWEQFEKFASEFLSEDYSRIRTMASPEGDDGRDAELFTSLDEPNIVFQYSVTEQWDSKIKKTVKRLKDNFKKIDVLIYVTNQIIGAKADKIKRSIQKSESISLDVIDRNWFIERANSSSRRENTSERLATEIVDPYLNSKGVIEYKALALDSFESRTAFMFLELQLEDDNKDKGLTKTSFEALVRAALQNTNSTNFLSRKQIHNHILSIVSNQHKEQTVKQIDAALLRLNKKAIRHQIPIDSFCLTHDESIRVKEKLVESIKSELLLIKEISDLIESKSSLFNFSNKEEIAKRCKRVIEIFLLERGEAFASTVINGNYRVVDTSKISVYINNDIAKYTLNQEERKAGTSVLNTIIKELLINPGSSVKEHLHSLANSYTLLAFLKETPDIHQVTSKMFASGDIWVDTNIILALLAETLADEEFQQFTPVIRAASEAGLRLHVTDGVIEEINKHIDRSVSCSVYKGRWDGSTPFLYSIYVASGRKTQSFTNWIENFKGRARPEDDLRIYLQETYDIQSTNLQEELRTANKELSTAVKAAWMDVHENRRAKFNQPVDIISINRLAEHDYENYLGIIERRKQESNSSFGYKNWWLTLDKAAYEIMDAIKSYGSNIKFTSPVMSPDFMINYLSLGPIRRNVSKHNESILPIILELSSVDALNADLIKTANDIRERYKNLPEHIIRRKVRDALDEAKSKSGRIVQSGLQFLEDELISSFKKSGQ